MWLGKKGIQIMTKEIDLSKNHNQEDIRHRSSTGQPGSSAGERDSIYLSENWSEFVF